MVDRLDVDALVGGPFDTGNQMNPAYLPAYAGAPVRLHNRLEDARGMEIADTTDMGTRVNPEIGGMKGTVPAIGWTDYLQTGTENFWLDGRMARQRQMRPNPSSGPVGRGSGSASGIAYDYPAYSEADIKQSLLRSM